MTMGRRLFKMKRREIRPGKNLTGADPNANPLTPSAYLTTTLPFKHVQAEVTQIENLVVKIKEIKTQDEYQHATNTLAKLRRAQLAIKNQLTFHTNPLKQELKTIERKFIPLADPLQTMGEVLMERIAEFLALRATPE